ncbi:MAG: hypothetical protein H0W27_01500 [Actinobacteria bacterium]|nr:hypothetical protein [Actinomycetota bacterium]
MRIVNRVLAAVLAIALIILGFLVAAEIVLAALGRTDPWILPFDRWYLWGREHVWSDPSTRRWLVLVCVVGLGLVVIQLIRRRPEALAMVGRSDRVRAELSRSSLEKALARAAGEVDGVTRARTRADEGIARIFVHTSRREPGAIEEQVASAAQEILRSLDLQDPPHVSVVLRTREGATR